ncbi:hypothetical protein D623_10011610 [Myotis brandtii]|uniref:Uncharacterized protein n=1 Tax=Myotis brandtii TaxID=109478 RepID=S7Q7H6_MYOBR|nr:hypothetical protein D623_10011610 [Myotis brandtii]
MNREMAMALTELTEVHLVLGHGGELINRNTPGRFPITRGGLRPTLGGQDQAHKADMNGGRAPRLPQSALSHWALEPEPEPGSQPPPDNGTTFQRRDFKPPDTTPSFLLQALVQSEGSYIRKQQLRG